MPLKKGFNIVTSHFCTFFFVVIGFLSCFSNAVNAQNPVTETDNSINSKDLGDMINKLLHKKKDTAKSVKSRSTAILPSLGYNPSFGFVIGAKASAIKNFGRDPNTDLSSFGLEAIYTSKGIITAQFRHNVFAEANKWNIQGNWQLSKFLITDYGIGTGHKSYLAFKDSGSIIRFTFIRLSEKIYRKIGRNLFAGAGISFDIRSNINDEKLPVNLTSPHYRYNIRNGIDPRKYSANGFLLAIQYNTREHPIRSFGGIYADLILRFNQKWLGSSKNAVQLIYDFRKYLSLSKKNPEHVLAFWHWASYKISGTIPYLELPTTANDTYNRSGRAYTLSRFKGLSYACFESEYRFPITRNKLLSGVAFVNFQSASDDLGKNIFQYWEPAAGGGLRILVQKQSRSTLCIDYAFGKYGVNGFFFGLNEVF